MESLSVAVQAELDAHHTLLEPEVAFSVLRAAEDPAKQGVTVYVINPSIQAAEHPLQYWYRASCTASSGSDRGCGAQVASECASVGGIPEDIDGGHGARCRLLIDLRAGPSSYGRRSSQTGKVNAASMLTTHPDHCNQHDPLADSDRVRAANAPMAELVMHSVQHMIVRQSTAVDVRERAVLRLLVVSQHPQGVRGWLGTDSVRATPLQPDEGTTLGVEMGWSRYDVAQLYVKCQNGGAVGTSDQDRQRVCAWVRGLAAAGQALDGHAPLARSALEVEVAIVRWDSCLVCQQAFEAAIESHKVRLSSDDWAVAEWVQADVLAHMLRSLASTSGLKNVPPTDMLHRLWNTCGRGCTPVPAVLFHLPEATQEVMLQSRRLATEVSWSLKPLGVQPWLHHQRSAPTVDTVGDDGETYELNAAAELPGLLGLSTAASATTFPTDLECNGNAVLLDKHNPFPQLLQGLAAVLFGVQPTHNCFGKVGGAACVWEPVLPVVSEFQTPVCPRSIAPMQWGLSRVLGIAARIQFIASDLLRDIAWIGLDPFQPDTNGVHAAVAAGLTVDEVDQWRAGWNLVHTSLERGLEAANGFDFLTAHRHLNMAIGAVVRLRLRHDAQQATWELTSVCSKPPPAQNVAKVRVCVSAKIRTKEWMGWFDRPMQCACNMRVLGPAQAIASQLPPYTAPHVLCPLCPVHSLPPPSDRFLDPHHTWPWLSVRHACCRGGADRPGSGRGVRSVLPAARTGMEPSAAPGCVCSSRHA